MNETANNMKPKTDQGKKTFAAWLDDKSKFMVTAPDIEQARIEVANVTAMLYLEYDIVCEVIKIEEHLL